ncbi:alpha/beta fold hydrolase [Microbacterium excoecariae]|uniref:alpha/beta fold hydrolase n=1 Tax=Microbacterium excoecariae TaxID=2715210 RepID=UPI00140884A5|nr:alpha/beta hydrolase [Microbacterium excoecariae]NHI17915.1 alpha/beta hydrolase [Microbacterium excoecariae]
MAIPLVTEMPDPQFVMSREGFRIATYAWGDEQAPTVLAVHGFASSCRDNWVQTGWVRELLRQGLRVVGIDQRGHGQSEKPHEPTDCTMDALVADIEAVIDTHMIDPVRYLGYSLGARVGWHAAAALPERIERAVLGGIPDGRPLGRLDLTQAREFAASGAEVTDPVTRNYVALAERVAGNDLNALVALAGGMRFGDADPDLGDPPTQPVLFATGSEDRVLEDSRRLAAAVPTGTFVEIPGRHHFNTPGAREFRRAGAEFLAAP